MAKLQTPRSDSREPLESFNVLRTRDPGQLHERLAALYAVSKLELPRGKARFNAVLNHYTLKSVALSYARYGAPVRITMSNTDFYTQGFGIRGHGEAVTDGRFFVVAKGKGGAAGQGASALLSYQAGFEHVFLRISPEALDRKLAALLGNPPSRSLTLRGKYDQAALGAQYRLVKFLISELDPSKDAMPPHLLAELEQALIVAYLCANLSNYSDLLHRKSPTAASWQVQRAADYIEMNWDKPITIESLASATETSARSSFRWVLWNVSELGCTKVRVPQSRALCQELFYSLRRASFRNAEACQATVRVLACQKKDLESAQTTRALGDYRAARD
jgi:hypothetical protein